VFIGCQRPGAAALCVRCKMTKPAFKVGDRVKLVSIPPEVERDRSRFSETFALFQLAVGRVFDIRGFDEYGHAELWLHPDGAPAGSAAADSVWVEPKYLLAV
jgi:hypothetical protein